jgi:hypothetical protein
MTDARTLTMALGGRWWRGYGSAPCPVCQPERRKDQDALTLKRWPRRASRPLQEIGLRFSGYSGGGWRLDR